MSDDVPMNAHQRGNSRMNAFAGEGAMNAYQVVDKDGQPSGGGRMNAYQRPGSPPGLANAPELQGQNAAPAASAAMTGDTAPVAGYTSAGVLSSQEVIDGDADRYAFLDPLIVEVTAWVQQALVAADRADDIDEARRDPAKRGSIEQEIDRLALQYMLRERRIRGDEGKRVIASVVNDIVGLGPLEPLWQDKNITEVIVNGPDDVFVEQNGKLVRAKACRFRSQEHLLEVCQRILMPLNRKVDVRDPLADGRLPDGSRVNVVHQTLAPKGPLLTIRRFPEKNRSLVDLVDIGSMDREMATLIATLIANKCSVLVVGGTGSGKTTLLNALSVAIPTHERVVTIEDSLELRLNPTSHVAAMEARPADSSGKNAVPIRQLVKNSLRMRPDRIIVGEIRDSAALDMLQACNTGHEGSMSTVHANGPDEALSRLTVMVAQGGEIPADKVEWLIGSAIDLIVIARRYEDGSRRVAGVYEVPDVASLAPGESLHTIPLWEWEQTGVDDDGRLIGKYVKKNDISERLAKAKGLEHGKEYTWDTLVELCGAVPDSVDVVAPVPPVSVPVPVPAGGPAVPPAGGEVPRVSAAGGVPPAGSPVPVPVPTGGADVPVPSAGGPVPQRPIPSAGG